MSKTYDIINYGKEYKGALVGVLSNTVEGITIPSEIDGVTVPLREDVFKGNTNLKKIDFNQCSVIPTYCCSGCANLESVSLGPVSSIGTYAFNNASKAVFSGSIDGIFNIPNYAFYYAGSAAATGFVYKPASAATIGQYAFKYSNLTELEGSFAVGKYGCADLYHLTKAHIFLSGAVGDYAFYRATNVSNFALDPESAPTSIGTYAFYDFGYSRSNPTSDVFKWDLRNCKITSIPSYCWGYNRASLFLLSDKVTSISTYAFAYGSDLILYLNSLPALSSTDAFRSTTNLSVVLNYELDDSALKAKTNWTTYASYIKSGITGYVGELAQYTESTGLALTWYSDSSMTTQVTEAVDANAIYYASKGAQREVWCVESKLMDASIIVSDGTTTYDKFVPVGMTVTITPSYTDPEKNQLYILEVDGVDCTAAGSATVVADHDIQVTVLYWDGVNPPFLPNLADNDFSMIKLTSKLGVVPSTWNVGDEITVKYDGTDYKCRLVDKTGKFTRVADGSTAYLYFEFENLLPGSMAYNPNSNNVVASSPLLASMNSGYIWDKLDSDLKAILEDVNVLVSPQGSGSPAPTNHAFKLFLPREGDLFSTRGGSAQSEFNAIAQDEYYQTHNTDNDRRKAKLSSPTSYTYWELSPHAGDSGIVCYVGSSGNAGRNYAEGAYGVAPRFVL